MVRLVFRPYTQVRRSICTLESLRPPPEFPLASPYSGIVHHLSGPNRYTPTQTFHRRSWSVDGASKRNPTNQVTCASWVCHPPARIHVRLLGPCFKTGRMEALSQRPEGADAEARRSAPFRPRSARRYRQGNNPCFFPARLTHADQRLALIGGGANPHIKPRRTSASIRFPLNNFKHF